MKINTDAKKIEALLSRGVENVYPTKEFLEKELKSGRQLTLYTGYDPTAPTLHIGHGITMLKLRQFQDLGHKVIMLIGDFTGMIGDPTDKTSARQKLTKAQVLENCKNYQKQASSILDFKSSNKVEVRYNSKWLGKLDFADVLELASHFTVQQMLQRDMFKRRMSVSVICKSCGHLHNIVEPGINENEFEESKGLVSVEFLCSKCNSKNKVTKNEIIQPKPIYLHEFMYPMMQGYDSVAMDVDGEIGGNDQTFNMLVGRDLIKELKNKEKFVLTTKLLTDDTGKKMGKTEGNMIAFTDSAEDMFGKVMRWSDGVIKSGFELCTTLPIEEIADLVKLPNPRDAKFRLAYEVTKTFLGEEAAKKGQEHFTSVIQDKEKPADITELKPTSYDIVTVLVEGKLVTSKAEARRAIEQGGVKVDDVKVETIDAQVQKGSVVQKGKRFFVKVK